MWWNKRIKQIKVHHSNGVPAGVENQYYNERTLKMAYKMRYGNIGIWYFGFLGQTQFKGINYLI